MKIAVITDSSSAMNKNECTNENLYIIPMPFSLNGESYFEDINITQQEFYKLLEDKNTVVSTSQPSIFVIEELWQELLTKYDAIIHLPISSGLSSTCETTIAKSKEPEFIGKVFVVDNKRVSVTLRDTVEDALLMIEDGYTAEEIYNYLIESQYHSSIYIMVPNLKYLKRGGRVTAAGAALGTLLNIKPVLQIQGGKLDAYKKVASIEKAKKVMIKALKDDIYNRFKEFTDKGEMVLDIAHTQNIDEANQLKAMLEEEIPELKVNNIDALSLIISSHIGPGSLACACSRRYKKIEKK